MYFPVLRGKQFELFALRELLGGDLVGQAQFCPVIEPVRQKLKQLISIVQVLNKKGISPLIVVNPTVGYFKGSSAGLMPELVSSKIRFLPCIAMRDSTDEASKEIIASCYGVSSKV